jgi:hypothetical protein
LAWIELHNDFFTNPKLKPLAASLGIEKMLAAAYLARFWSWAIDKIEDETGEISHLDYEEISAAAGWRKSPEKFVTALISSRWFDSVDGKLFIHDWNDYAGRLIRKRKYDRERKRKKSDAIPREIPSNSDGIPCDHPTELPVEVVSSTVPNLTVPNLTVPCILSKDNTSAGTDGPASAEIKPRDESVNLCPHQKIMDIYNTVCINLPKIKTMTEARQVTLRVWWKKDKLTLDILTAFFRRVEASDFLTGRIGSFHGCGFDWIIKSANRQKILEGNYGGTSGDGQFNGIKPKIKIMGTMGDM